MEYRTEHDSMGEVHVPADRYYGAQTARSLENFPFGAEERMPREIIHAFGLLKAAAAVANAALVPDRMTKNKLALIRQAAEEVAHGQLDDHFPLVVFQTGSGTQSNMNANEVIANRANELAGQRLLHPNDDINMSQSSNDTFPTAMHIAAVLAVEQALLPALHALIEAFLTLEKESRGAIKCGRTHLQDAVPITLGQEMGSYASSVRRGMRRISHALDEIRYINMGGTAVGTGLNAEPAYLAVIADKLSEVTGEQWEEAANLIDATNNTDGFADVSAAMKNTALVLIKMANDFRLMASGPRDGFYELKLPMRQPGSSIMPGKVNPVIAEVLNQTCYQVVGNDLAVSLAVENGQFELNVMEPVMAFNMFNSMKFLTNAVNGFVDKLLKDLEPNRQQCQHWLDRSVGVVTALLPHIGYEQSAQLAKEAYSSGRPIREIILEKGIMSEERLNEVMSPMAMTSPGIVGQ